MQQDAARQTEFAREQATVMSEQAELIGRLQQQTAASPSQQVPPPLRVPIPKETPNARNVQEDTDIPTGSAPPLIPPQQSKAPTPINLSNSPFESEPEQKRFEDSERIRKAKGHLGLETAANTEMENAASIGIKGTASIGTVVTEPDRCLSAADDLEDLPGANPENMAGESLTQLVRRKNAERMAARRRAKAVRLETPPTAVAESSLLVIAEETAQTKMAETEQVEQGDQEAEQRVKKHPAEREAVPNKDQTDKRPRIEDSDLTDFEASKAAEELARADSKAESARNSDQLRLAIEERAKASEDALKLAKEVIAKLEANLEESRKAKEIADSEISKVFQAGKDAALENYVEEVPKFENRGFKHSWLKALTAANMTLAQLIPYEQVDVEPLESNPED
ncbi:nucleolar and coiled-body phosphoprotein 1-like [Camellia sinensis]|uniref:nucleolar and coiled-body phosphoprotein 1-like n=1 Tax=Camellia sinensis TaxID=4442 RepID=UPI00103584D3|nr:nucleolar and coiled-body phosphoprotein 1-like [Camellia sinensis]